MIAIIISFVLALLWFNFLEDYFEFSKSRKEEDKDDYEK